MWIVVLVPRDRLSIVYGCRSVRLEHIHHMPYVSKWYWNERSPQQQKCKQKTKEKNGPAIGTSPPANTHHAKYAQCADNWKWHIWVRIHNHNKTTAANGDRMKYQPFPSRRVCAVWVCFASRFVKRVIFESFVRRRRVKLGQPCARIRMKSKRMVAPQPKPTPTHKIWMSAGDAILAIAAVAVRDVKQQHNGQTKR